MKELTSEIASVLSTWMSTDEVKSFVDSTRSASDEDTGTFRMIITTENLDRYEEVIALDGWELDHYLNSPVVLWGHDHFTPPVAVTDKLIKEDGKLIAEGRFAPTEMGQQLRKLYDLGFLRASSVGFIIKERQGNLITKAELIEWSFVSVPANPYALSLALEKELNINELVTKGFMSVIKEAEPVETPVETPVATETPAEPVVEKQFEQKALTPIVDQFRSILGALEALTKGEEPERTEEETPAADVTDEQKALEKFNAQRKTVQDAATVLGDVLAEMRQVSQSLRNK